MGYISNSCVDVDYEEVKRKILGQATPSYHPSAVRPINPEVYDDIGSNDQLDRWDPKPHVEGRQRVLFMILKVWAHIVFFFSVFSSFHSDGE